MASQDQSNIKHECAWVLANVCSSGTKEHVAQYVFGCLLMGFLLPSNQTTKQPTLTLDLFVHNRLVVRGALQALCSILRFNIDEDKSQLLIPMYALRDIAKHNLAVQDIEIADVVQVLTSNQNEEVAMLAMQIMVCIYKDLNLQQ